jgi:hypothetical protein
MVLFMKQGTRKVVLCKLCQEYFETESKHRNENVEIVWCAMIWHFLSHQQSWEKLGLYAWSVIPQCWRQFWIDSVLKVCPQSLASLLTLDYPKPVVIDIRKEKYKLEKAIKDGMLKKLVADVDRFLLPRVNVHGDVLNITTKHILLNWI